MRTVLCCAHTSGENGGGGWIRTTEARRNRFTICPLWPLGNSSIYGAGERTRTPDLLITNQLLYQLSYTSVKRVHDALGDPSEIRTPDTLIKSQVLCQLS